jgi:small-conductance mechanosensitive channel
MYFVWFHAELRSYRLSWGIVFLAVTLAIVLAERLSRDPSRGPRPAWRTILSFWIVANAAGLMVVSIFWYFGN